MIIAKNLCKTFHDRKAGDVHAVDNVSFTAVPGKIFALLGVNGAGKTTILRMLSTVIQPTSGAASVNGFDVVAQSKEVRKNIGFLSTSTALYGRLTPRESLIYFGGFYDLAGKELERRVDAAIELLQIGEFQNRLCDKLSTGQKQRVSIARSIVHDPAVLFFDEPTAGLDVLGSQIVMEFIEHARDQNKTIVFSTHIMSEVERLCDDIAVIHDGVLKASGSREALLSQTGEPSLEKAFLKLVEFKSFGFDTVQSA